MSNALDQAKALQRQKARKTTVIMPLDVLQALIAEIEHLNAELNETTDLLAEARPRLRDLPQVGFGVKMP
jgi:hypothetical protein